MNLVRVGDIIINMDRVSRVQHSGGDNESESCVSVLCERGEVVLHGHEAAVFWRWIRGSVETDLVIQGGE